MFSRCEQHQEAVERNETRNRRKQRNKEPIRQSASSFQIATTNLNAFSMTYCSPMLLSQHVNWLRGYRCLASCVTVNLPSGKFTCLVTAFIGNCVLGCSETPCLQTAGCLRA